MLDDDEDAAGPAEEPTGAPGIEDERKAAAVDLELPFGELLPPDEHLPIPPMFAPGIGPERAPSQIGVRALR